jgi:hypothetical protein
MRRSIRRAGITTVAATALVAGTMASGQAAVPRLRTGAERAATTSVVFTTLNTSVLNIKNSHRRRLDLTLSSTSRAGIPKASVSIALATGGLGSTGERHNWSFEISRSDLSYNNKTGHGKLATGTSLKTFGTIDLTFTKTSRTTSKCKGGTGHDTTIKGRLSGTLFFNTQTGSHGWGTVGSRHHRVTFMTPNTFSLLTSGCPIGTGSGSATCISGLFWSAPYATMTPSVSIFGYVTRSRSRTTSMVTFDQFQTIMSPAGASRTDTLIANEPVPKVSAGTLTITTAGHAITGSASIGNTTSSPNNYPCKASGKSYTEKATLHTGMWTGGPLVGHFSATGRADSPTSGPTSFTTESF